MAESYHQSPPITKTTTTTTTTTASDQPLRETRRPEFLCGVVEGFYGKPWTCSQRRDLFKRLKQMKMNTFMYGPKDDAKHRAKWRQAYNEVEAQQLKGLIDEAALNGIDFYYALAPGLDMVYSNDDDAMKICDKFSQLRDLGCKSFALLFDDIEPSVTNQKDKAVFNDNYALAQVLITNVVYEFLGKPNFLFCPTEYCESRAVPNVTDSNYLNMIGSGLHQGIDIMWSGSRVVSRYITEESIETLTKVIRRPPVIWENLHANDYDRKRVYLGPFSGRSTRLIPKLRGILTNPNCEYEANHIAIHTLAQWSRCNEDINPLNRCNQSAHPSNNHHESHDKIIYDPERALALAIRDWVPHLLSIRSLPPNQELSGARRDDQAASNQLAKESQVKEECGQHVDEMMSEDLNPSNNNNDEETKKTRDADIGVDSNSCDSCEMQEEPPGEPKLAHPGNQFDLDSLALLADFYYLPFEHGPRGHAFLLDVKWLMDNSDVFVSSREGAKNDDQQTTTMTVEDDLDRTIELWLERQQRIDSICGQLVAISDSLINDCPNKPLIAELRPYLSDLVDMISFINEYIKFLRHRKCHSDRFEHPYSSCNLKHSAQVASTDEQEPWVHRGGLIGDVHRLICPE